MISRLHRFHGHGSLNYLYKNGKTVRADFLSMRYAHARQPDYRLAVIVSKKVSKKAVVRNRIRRKIYEIVRLHRQRSSVDWPYDMAISVFDESLASMPPQKLDSLVLGLLKKSKII